MSRREDTLLDSEAKANLCLTLLSGRAYDAGPQNPDSIPRLFLSEDRCDIVVRNFVYDSRSLHDQDRVSPGGLLEQRPPPGLFFPQFRGKDSTKGTPHVVIILNHNL